MTINHLMLSHARTLPTSQRRLYSPGIVLLSVVIGSFASFLDATMVNISLISIQQTIQADLTTVSWVLSGYNIAFAVSLIPAGKLADQFGRKRLFLLGLLLFGGSSLACALARSVTLLVAARFLQGIGGATLSSVALSIISAVFPTGPRRNAALGVWGAVSGLAIAVGPVLGGLLTTFWSWPWIFLINAPLCLLGLALVMLFVPEAAAKMAARIDWAGALALVASISCLVLATSGEDWGGSSWLFLCLAGFHLLLFVLIERRLLAAEGQGASLIPFRIFTTRGSILGSICVFSFSLSLMGAFVILNLFVGEHKSPLLTALFIFPIPATSFVLSCVMGKLSRICSPYILGIVGLAALALGMFSLCTLPSQVAWWDMWRGVIIGIGMGLCFPSFPAITFASIAPEWLGVASGSFNTFQQLGFTLGVAFLMNIEETVGFQASWFVAACVAVVGGLLLFVFAPWRHMWAARRPRRQQRTTQDEDESERFQRLQQTLASTMASPSLPGLYHLSPVIACSKADVSDLLERGFSQKGIFLLKLSDIQKGDIAFSNEEKAFDQIIWPFLGSLLLHQANGLCLLKTEQQQEATMVERYLVVFAAFIGMPVLLGKDQKILQHLYTLVKGQQPYIWEDPLSALSFPSDQAQRFLGACIRYTPPSSVFLGAYEELRWWLRRQDKLLHSALNSVPVRTRNKSGWTRAGHVQRKRELLKKRFHQIKVKTTTEKVC